MVHYLEVVLKNNYVSRWKYTLEKLRLFFANVSAVDAAVDSKEKAAGGDCNEKTGEMDWKEKFGRRWFY